ncbi:MAG: deoxyhypusine synthase family protein [Candidatus Lokiarchaeota archaeon]|jgi:deoxyhypusine synthase
MDETHKADYLSRKIFPFDVTTIKTINDLLGSLKYCGFQGRNLGIAAEILYQMFNDENCLTILTLSGAMIPAGMGKLICELIDNKLIDVIISTGANITHDFIDATVNGGHYLGSENVDDDDLYYHRINRIYDVFLPEDNYDAAEKELLKIIKTQFPSKSIEITPSSFFRIIGTALKSRSILSSAAENKIPIFVPAISDSEFALDLVKFTETQGYDIDFRVLQDIKNFAEIIKSAESCGTFIIGGGVPRNWAQQIYPYIENIERLKRKDYEFGYKYSVRIHTAVEKDGGLSGCTLSESKSWGKYSLEAKYVSIWCDATIALPILITGVLQRLNLI